MSFKSTHADPCAWRHPDDNPHYEKYYEYIFTYFVDLLVIRKYPKVIMDDISTTFKFNNYAVDIPQNYLG